MEKLLTINEAAEALRLSPHTLRAWISQRKIPVHYLGRKIVFRISDLERLVEEGRREARPQ